MVIIVIYSVMKKDSKRGTETKSAKLGITPLGDRVLIKPMSEEDLRKKLPSGIILPETIDKEKPAQGKVVSVGPGKRDDRGVVVPVEVQVGDRIVFSKYGYDEVSINDEEYYIISESNVLAVIK